MTLLMDMVAALGRSTTALVDFVPATPKDVRRDIAQRAAVAIRGATRFLLTDDMVSLALDLAEGPAGRLAAAVDLVRAPAETWWMEWSEHHRQREVLRRFGIAKTEIAGDVAERVGLLLQPSSLRRAGLQAATSITLSGGKVMISPVGFSVDWGNPDFSLERLTAPDSAGSFRTGHGDLDDVMLDTMKALLGTNYSHRQVAGEAGIGVLKAAAHVNHDVFKGAVNTVLQAGGDAMVERYDTLQRLAGYGTVTLSPIGGWYMSVLRKSGHPGATDMVNTVTNMAMREQSGDYRFLLSVLAVIQSARDAVSSDESPRVIGRRGAPRSLTSSPQTHKVIALRIHPDEIRRRLAEGERAARAKPRWYSFIGHRCYSRKRGNPACEHEWFRPDPDRDFHVCSRCDMRSWPRRGGERGDKAQGTVEKTYLVSAR
jgi:hypothetical protein